VRGDGGMEECNPKAARGGKCQSGGRHPKKQMMCI
jgi:hypothetical protein